MPKMLRDLFKADLGLSFLDDRHVAQDLGRTSVSCAAFTAKTNLRWIKPTQWPDQPRHHNKSL